MALRYISCNFSMKYTLNCSWLLIIIMVLTAVPLSGYIPSRTQPALQLLSIGGET